MAITDNNWFLLGNCQLHWCILHYNVFGNLEIFPCVISANMWIMFSFFLHLLQMEKSDDYKKGSGASKKWDGGGPGGPGSGPYGGGPRGPPRGLDNVRGIDHSKSCTTSLNERIFQFNFLLHVIYFLLNSSNSQSSGSLPACGSCCGWGAKYIITSAITIVKFYWTSVYCYLKLIY